MKIGQFALALTLTLAAGLCAPAHADTDRLRITHQPSTVYLPLIIMEQQKLVEEEARKAGLNDLKVEWLTLTSGGASVDALMSGNVDLVTSGVSNLILIWDKSKGEVKGVAGASAVPMVLVTRDPEVKKLEDFTERDRIAVPTVKVSMQAIVLQIACEKLFGFESRNKFDALTVQLGHPDAAAALSDPKNQINSHFSLPPFLAFELANPGVHAVLNSSDVMGGPVSNGVVFGTKKFHDANPKVMAAFSGAMDVAMNMIKTDPRRAAEVYLAATKEKISVDELTKLITAHDLLYSKTPTNTMKIADYMHRAGMVKSDVKSWKDYFFPELHALPGT
ncbi:MAG: ABC transporter substrate-binding protein [Beijerinckiaceae bacterium]